MTPKASISLAIEHCNTCCRDMVAGILLNDTQLREDETQPRGVMLTSDIVEISKAIQLLVELHDPQI